MANETTTEPVAAPRPPKPSTTKKARLEKLIRRRQGASLETLMTELDWQAHTIRAAISRLKKDGSEIVLDRAAKTPVYRIAPRGDD